MLELEHTCKQYASPGGSIRAVDDVSVTVAPGELAAILGPSGSGKTTLLLLSAGLIQADAGHVRFDGVDLGSLSKRDALLYRRTKLGLVFQNFNLIPGLTAEENVALPLLLRGVHRREAHRQAVEALSEVELAHRTGHTPTQLSGGEQQRVAIARAIVGKPQLLLADEPTGNLDSDTGDDILELLLRLPQRRGVTMVMVTHDARAAGCADRMFTMRDGKLAAAAPLPVTLVSR
jgi:putative ABC transport system ATP-binding protein